MLRRKSQHSAAGVGFTQVELLVVIGIIALLAAVLLPSVENARRSAKPAAVERQASAPRTAVVRAEAGSVLPEPEVGQSTAAQAPPPRGSGLTPKLRSLSLTPERTKKRVGPPTADDQTVGSAAIANTALVCTGDTCDTAISVASLPFSTSGNTCSCVSNYDVETFNCTPDVISSPDVVYRYAPSANGCIDITLCGGGTTFDSKVILFQNTCSAAIDCNDDSCGLQSELRDVPVAAGNTYYIVVDGYDGDCGDYQLKISPCAGPCNLTCDLCATPENEPNCGLPVDTVNGGCLSTPRKFTPLTCGDTFCGTGAFNGNTRDTDWYKLVLGVPTTVTWTVAAEFQAVVGVIETGGIDRCPAVPNFRVSMSTVLGPCTTGSVSGTLPAGTWYLIVAPDFAGLVPCGAEYNAALTCGSPTPEACCMPDGSCQILPDGQCACRDGTVVSHCPSDGRCVPPGDDCFTTQCGRTLFDFCNDPIPADFFAPSSEPFTGVIILGGDGDPDTTVRRLDVMLLDGPPETIPIELIQLSLSSCSPITVSSIQDPDTLWNVKVDLSPTPVPPGSMTVTKQHPNGGVFNAQFNVLPRFTFTEVGNPSNIRVLDTGAEGIPPEHLMTVGGEPWVRQMSPQIQHTPCGVNFVPGVEENPITHEQCCTETCHANPSGGHDHCTKQCNVCPRGACCNPQNGTCSVVQGAAACAGQYKGDGTNCADSDTDGIPDWFENNDCCRSSTTCNIASNPNDPDTDNDGIKDGAEIAQLCDPCTAGDCIPKPCCLPSGSCQSLSSGQCAAGGGRVVSHCPSDGRCVPPGDDCFSTQCGRTLFDFCNDPIPADFFAPSSDPFTGIIILGGDGAPDTTVRRFNAMLLDGPPETIPIELVQLSLTSCSPITVTSITDPPSQWSVAVDLSPHPVQPGSMTVTKQHPNGGVFTAQFNVLPRFTFTEINPPTGNQRILDFGTEGRPPTLFSTTDTPKWVHQSPLPSLICGVNFVPSVQENPRTLEQCCTETCHASPGGGHEHCTKTCQVCPRGACCGPQNTCTIADGALACQGQYKGDGTNCDDSDGDGLADVFERNDCCQPSSPCNSASSPTDPDTDNDGVMDGDEVTQGCDPCIPGCGSVPCCLPLGACVYPNSPAACQGQGGTPLPSGSLCQGDLNGDGIDDACFAPSCAECGPGLHWIHNPNCPPGGSGLDTLPSGAVLGLDLNLDPNCIADNNIVAGGPVTIKKTGPFDDSVNFPGTRPIDGHKDVIDTEIIAMSLTGGGMKLRAGAGQGVGPNGGLLAATKGAIAEQPGNPALADSFFDVFFEIDVSGNGSGPFIYNQTPILVGQVIDCVPPKAIYYHFGGCTPLYTSPTGGIHVANLTAANHFTYPACCATVLAGGCQNNISVQKCQQLGGTTVPTCLGDINPANGIDDACDPKCEVAPGSVTGCTNVCPLGTPVGQQCLPSSYGCDPNNQGSCGVLACNCDCHLIFGAAGPSCQGSCPNAAEACPPAPLGDGSIGNPYRCECAPQPTECEPNAAGTACNPVTCPNDSEECVARCGKLNPFTGQVTVNSCDCRPLDECHLAKQQIPAVTAGGGGNPCVVQGNGGGSVDLPPAGCEYLSPDEVHKIIAGLPAGTEIHLAPIHKDFICHQPGTINPVCSFSTLVDCKEAGGSLGGEKECSQSTLEFQLTGTGTLAGWNRMVTVPMAFETHTAPRTPGDPVQSFDTEMFRMFGQINQIGDPDFDLLRIVAGTDFSMPSPGHTTLTKLPGGPNWAVDSFFDITYRIDFVGAPGGPLAGMSGSTTATIRMQTGKPLHCEGGCPAGQVCNEKRTVNADGTIEVCCDCKPPPDPHQTADGTSVTFGSPDIPPIPADFFYPGSEPFNGTVNLRKQGDADTLIQRSDVIICPCAGLPPCPCDPIDVEIVALSLVSVNPIPVGPHFFDVFVDLSINPQPLPPGGAPLNLTKQHANGGVFSAEIWILPRITFTEVGNPGNVKTIDYGLAGLPHIRVNFINVPWVINLGPGLVGTIAAPSNGNFVPGVQETVPGNPNSQVVVTANGISKGGGVNHPIDPVPLCPLPQGAADPCAPFQARDCQATGAGQLCLPIVWGIGAAGPYVKQCGCDVPGGCTVDMFHPAGPTCNPTNCPADENCTPFFDVVNNSYSCDCVPPPVCEPNATGTACNPTTCPNHTEECLARCGKVNPFTGQITVNSCDCRRLDECHLRIPQIPAVTAGGGGNPCVVPDNGGGSVDLPPAGCEYLSPDEVHKIIDGLPAGTEIHLAPIHKDFICNGPGTINPVCSSQTLVDCKEAGGSLGGEKECAESKLQFDLSVLNPPCPGPLCGWTRSIQVPMAFETHTAPRTPGDPVQSFDTDMFRMFGQINQIGDPDFDLLRVVAGTDFGMPSPGHTTLTKLPGGPNWAVDSFFDITYRIDFVGAPGGRLAGRSGSTTATIRMQTGAPFRCEGGCPAGFVCEENRVVNADGTIDLCCDCQAATVCEPNSAGTDCNPVTCPDPGTGVVDKCRKKCVIVNPLTGAVTLSDCDCVGPTECHMELSTAAGTANAAGTGPSGECVVVDDGSGTVKLPPDGCPYLSPDEFHKIVNGLPIGVTIEIGAIHKNFICNRQPLDPGFCSFPIPPGVDCDDEEPNDVTDGEKECSDSTLELNMRGTGMGNTAGPSTYMRMLNLPVRFETHTGPRMPGDPVQSFDTDMFRLQGQLPPGDPDFDLLRITAGTGFGMPSPGHTTLTRGLPGGGGGERWAVDSFFDIEYRIDFIGAPGGPFAGMSGSTTGTIRMATKVFKCVGDCPPGTVCTEQRTPQADGTIKVCCECVAPPVCETDPTTGACRPNTCPAPEVCIANCAKVTQVGGATTVTATDCHCDDPNICHLKVGASGAVTAGPGGPCEVIDNGSGSVDLPPAGCDYLSPDEVHKIINGLPAGTEIHLAPIHKDFICHEGQPGGVCSFPLGVDCREDGGDLGGEKECSSSTLEFQLTGTGTLAGWNRMVTIPNVSFETHIGKKKPGQPVQSFPTEMFRLFGQISNIGDPDFDLLRVVAGNDFALPSPGHTTLTQLPNGNWAVDSFFDITYRIDFVGNPASTHLAGRSGSTTATIRMATNAPFKCTNTCPPGQVCVQTTTQLSSCLISGAPCDDTPLGLCAVGDTCIPNATMTVCCDCEPTEACCLPTGACTQLPPSRCSALNGTPQGPGSTCLGRDCPGAGDCNHDGHSDLRDIAAFQNCFTGSGGPNRCACTDLDADGDTDLDDWKIFKRAMTGP